MLAAESQFHLQTQHDEILVLEYLRDYTENIWI